jgi:hypothetical protein
MSRGSSLGLLSGFTAQQWGMVTASQARAAGVSRTDVARLIADGALEDVPGAARVYRLAGAPVDPDRDPIHAAWLQLGGSSDPDSRLRTPDAVVAGRSAALVQDLGDLPALAHEFYVTRRRQPRRTDLRLHVRGPLPADDWTIRDGLPVCTVPRVVGDLLHAREDGESVARICQDAVRLGLLDPADLTHAAGPYAAAYGVVSPATFTDLLLNGWR